MPDHPTPPDHARLAKLLEMLDSGHDGEALAAARKAHQLVRAAGLRWRDVLGATARSTLDQSAGSRPRPWAMAAEAPSDEDMLVFLIAEPSLSPLLKKRLGNDLRHLHRGMLPIATRRYIRELYAATRRQYRQQEGDQR